MNQIYYSAYANDRRRAPRAVTTVRAGSFGRRAVASPRNRIGAVRREQATPLRVRRALQWTALVGCAAGGVLLASANMAPARDTSNPERTLAHAIARPAVPETTFFFGDEADLLTERERANHTAHQPGHEYDTADALPGSRRPDRRADPRGRPNTAPLDSVHAAATEVSAQDSASDLAIENASQPARSLSATTVPAAPVAVAMHANADDDRSTLSAPAFAANVDDEQRTEIVEVRAGDSLSAILNRHGVGVAEMRPLLGDPLVKTHLSTLEIGQQFAIVRRVEDGAFDRFIAKIGRDRRLTIRRSDKGFAVATIDLPVERERVVTSGTIETSLFAAAAEADLKQATIMSLADIFQWELDFGRDIRRGDAFAIVYDRLYREGKYIGDGDILAAEFVRGASVHRAIRFTDAEGQSDYYSPDGQSKRRTFMRHPVDVVRITSHFDPNRMHPVLHQIRAHRGTDYGAAYGSEIRATADGTITHAGPRSSYGNTVILQHGQRVTTLYAHMSELAPSARSGARVRQGEVIGYVGNTGRVTGTHLHYEFRVDGVHVDPLTVELPAAEPLPAALHADLALQSDRLLAQIRSVLPSSDDATVAMADSQ